LADAPKRAKAKKRGATWTGRWLWFVDGIKRPVYQRTDGRQFVLDEDGELLHGVWMIPVEDCVFPTVVVETERGNA
jgi:hypothetical protein